MQEEYSSSQDIHEAPGTEQWSTAASTKCQMCQSGMREALLDLTLANQENLLCRISVGDSLGCSDHNIEDLGSC